jgi:hypothetical protein
MKNQLPIAKTETAKVDVSTNTENTKPSPIGEAPVTGESKRKLKQCEDSIRQNEKGVFFTGRNLAMINNEKLYKADGFTAFPDYCRARWGMSDKHAYRLIDAALCYDVLADHQTDKPWVLPRNESQIRPLIKVDEKEWVASWEKVMAKFGTTPFTAEDINQLLHPEATVPEGTVPNADAPQEDGNGANPPVEPPKDVPAKKLKKNLEKIDELVKEALLSAATKETIPTKDYCKLLEKIKKLTENIK